MAGVSAAVAMFELDEALAAVTFDGQAVPFEVEAVRVDEFAGRVPERHTFSTRTPDGLVVQVSWSPAMPAGRAWVECSYDAGLFRLDRRDRWAELVHLVATPGEWPCKFTPQLLAAGKVYELVTAAYAGHGFPLRVA